MLGYEEAMEHYYALIMAGGGGTRLWPLSRSTTPKQLLPLVEENSMFRVSVERLAPLFTPDRIYVVAGTKHIEALRAQAPELPAENFIAEPFARDSGPAAALGITVIEKRDPEATVVLLTADHHIADKEGFRRALAAAYAVAQHNTIVTLGISAAIPSTGFGYIRRGERLCEVDGFSAYHSLGFTEKPDLQTAMTFIASGDYSWNSGMFAMRAETAMAEFERQQPEIYRLMRQLQPTVDTPEYQQTLDDVWQEIMKISIDFAIMEGALNMAIIPVDIGWSDVGSWDALFDVLQPDDSGNCFKGSAPDRITVDTKNTLVYSDKLTVTIGIENIVIVDTDDVLMVVHRDRAQDVREAVNTLREKNSHSYL
jgi:mannose-1-phosphate guanylyltransferase